MLIPKEPRSEVSDLRVASVAIGQELAGSLQELLVTKYSGCGLTVGVALGCRASAIIYQNTRVYGDYQLIIAINASTRQLTVQPNATPNHYRMISHFVLGKVGRIPDFMVVFLLANVRDGLKVAMSF